jgi:hypothetical protein
MHQRSTSEREPMELLAESLEWRTLHFQDLKTRLGYEGLMSTCYMEINQTINMTQSLRANTANKRQHRCDKLSQGETFE